jgi:hypothetical protein
MTVVRREDVQSNLASWDEGPYRLHNPPILTIVPLLIRRLRGPSLGRITKPSRRVRSPLVHRHRRRLECRPEEACQFSRNRHGDLRRGLVLFRQAPEATTQSLLRFVGDRNHTARLSLPPPSEGNADTGPVLIVPRRFHEQPADQRISSPGDATTPMLLAARIFARHEAEIGHQGTGRWKPTTVVQLGKD